jgi:hypothetical protein
VVGAVQDKVVRRQDGNCVLRREVRLVRVVCDGRVEATHTSQSVCEFLVEWEAGGAVILFEVGDGAFDLGHAHAAG